MTVDEQTYNTAHIVQTLRVRTVPRRLGQSEITPVYALQFLAKFNCVIGGCGVGRKPVLCGIKGIDESDITSMDCLTLFLGLMAPTARFWFLIDWADNGALVRILRRFSNGSGAKRRNCAEDRWPKFVQGVIFVLKFPLYSNHSWTGRLR